MKSCPTCNRTFEDTLTYCLIDGAILSAPFDPQATLIIPQARQTEPPPTVLMGSYPKHDYTPEVPQPYVAFESPVKKPNRLPLIIGGIIALLIATASIVYIVQRSSADSNISEAKEQSTNEGEGAVNPKETPAQLAQESESLFKQSKFAEAESKIRQAVKLYPNNHKLRDDLRGILARLNKESEAKEVAKESEGLLREALRSEPNNAKLHAFLSGALRTQERLKEAETEDREAIRLDPNDAMAHMYLSNTLRQLNRLEEAEAEAREAVRLDPDDYVNHYVLSGILGLQKKYEEAEKSIREAIRLAPEYAHAHAVLGHALNGQNRNAEAEVKFRDAIKLAPDIADNHFYLANALFRLGRLEDSEAALQEAIKLDPSNSSYKEALQQIRDAMKKK